MLLIWSCVIIATVTAIVLILGDDRETRRMLEERWARGEIDANMYRAHVARLEGSR